MRAIERHAAELTSFHVRNPVVHREPLVHERIVRCQELEDAPVFAQHALHKEVGFAVKRFPQAVVEVGIERHGWLMCLEVARLEPLPHEIVDKRA